MFSVRQKREIADAVQKVLKATNHPELPLGEIRFNLHVDGFSPNSWADIQNNAAVPNPDVNPRNEAQDPEADRPSATGDNFKKAERILQNLGLNARMPPENVLERRDRDLDLFAGLVMAGFAATGNLIRDMSKNDLTEREMAAAARIAYEVAASLVAERERREGERGHQEPVRK